ncbi:MAG: hypothetical protein H0U64_08675 [Gemmatimonadaceae bacterium]|nr:hypothetical protein [Gemmatimonadaceae bacterium]
MVARSHRSLLLAVILIGNLGLQVELLLLDHAETFNQWIPHLTLAIGLVAIGLVFFTPSGFTVLLFRIVMFGFIGIGLLGLFLHYRGNVEFARERWPTLGGTALVWKALRGATPALAPGALAQLGLLGLLHTYRNPHLSLD